MVNVVHPAGKMAENSFPRTDLDLDFDHIGQKWESSCTQPQSIHHSPTCLPTGDGRAAGRRRQLHNGRHGRVGGMAAPLLAEGRRGYWYEGCAAASRGAAWPLKGGRGAASSGGGRAGNGVWRLVVDCWRNSGAHDGRRRHGRIMAFLLHQPLRLRIRWQPTSPNVCLASATPAGTTDSLPVAQTNS